jgi:glutathione S-transferase
MIRITAFRWVPPFAQGLVRDLRVRWALEEAGFPYEVRLIGREDQALPEYRRLQPFGQVPVFEDGDLTLFESGAIVQHIAEQSGNLMPPDPNGRARIKAWLFAAMNSVEPQIANLASIDLFHSDEEWARLRRPGAVEAVHGRLSKLSDWLEGRDYLEDRFSAADLLMTSVLRNLRHTDLVEQLPVLEAYRERCMARPAFQKALADQLATFAENDAAVRTASSNR